MPSTIRYPLDLTGIDPNNLLVNEPCTLLPGSAARIYVPLYPPFFSGSMVLTDTANNNRTLIRGSDYELAEIVEVASLRTGKEVMSLVLITNQFVSNSITARYQTIGGEYQNDSSAIARLYNLVINDNRPVDWVNVLNKPTAFPPTLHKHLLEDVVGFEYLVSSLERIRNAVSATDLYVIDYFMNWVNNRLLAYGDTKQGIVITNKTSYMPGETINVIAGSRDLLYPTQQLTWSIRHLQTNPNNFSPDQGNFNITINRGDFNITVANNGNNVISPKQFQIDFYEGGVGSYNFATSPILTLIPAQ